ncbi:MAG: peptidylprolyl isomerase, partial [Rhodoferax sp.]
MNKRILSALATAAVLSALAPLAQAQNVAIVNGKAVPKARIEALMQQVARSGRPVTPEMEGQIKDEVIA